MNVRRGLLRRDTVARSSVQCGEVSLPGRVLTSDLSNEWAGLGEREGKRPLRRRLQRSLEMTVAVSGTDFLMAWDGDFWYRLWGGQNCYGEDAARCGGLAIAASSGKSTDLSVSRVATSQQ